MSVIRQAPTKDILIALREGLNPYLGPKDSLRNALAGTEGDREALRIYRVGLQDVARGNWHGHEFIGWRFLAVAQDKPGIIVNVRAFQGLPPRVGAVLRSPYVSRTIEAVRAVPVPPTAVPDDTELTLLNIPGLQTETFWIRSANTEGDGWIVPYNTLIRDFQMKYMYTIQEFFDIAQPLAQRLVEQFDRLEDNSVEGKG